MLNEVQFLTQGLRRNPWEGETTAVVRTRKKRNQMRNQVIVAVQRKTSPSHLDNRPGQRLSSLSTGPTSQCSCQVVPYELDEALLQKCLGFVEVFDLRGHLQALALSVVLTGAQSALQLLAELLCGRVGFLRPEGWKCREIQQASCQCVGAGKDQRGFLTHLVAASLSRSVSLSNRRMVASASVMWASFSAESCMNCSIAALIGCKEHEATHKH